MANIRKRDDGTWQATIYVGRDADGKKINEYITKHSFTEIKKAVREREQEIEEGKLTNVGNTRLVVWTEKWLEINKNNYSPSTRVLYKSYIDNHYKSYFKQLKLKEINEIHLVEFQNELLEKMSPTSARRVMSALRKMLGDALKKKSPAADLKLPKEKKRDYKIPTTKEFDRIHEAVKGTRDEPIVLLAGWCGLRRAEIFALRKNDINIKQGIIRIDEGLAINEENEYEFKDPKSQNSIREVPVPDYLMNLLKNISGKRQRKKSDSNVEEIDAKQKEKDDRLFSNRPDNYSSYWAKLVRRKRMPKIRFHDLRHYYATWLYHNDVPDLYAAKFMGDDIDTVKRIYQHIERDKEKELADTIRNLHNPDAKKVKRMKLRRSTQKVAQ